MEKNTIWAIVLSALVIIGSVVVEVVFLLPKQREAMERQQAEMELTKKQQEEMASAVKEQISTADSSEFDSEVQESVPEQQYTIRTDLVEAVFTNRGGDLISYKFLKHNDKDTGTGVQMVDNVTATNRAFGLSFGGPDNAIINETFNVKMEGDSTIIFTRDFFNKDALGTIHKFTLLKRYEFLPGDYAFKLGIGVKTYDSNGLNINDAAYSLRTSPQIGPHYDIKKNRYEVRQFLSLRDKKRKRKPMSDKIYSENYDWAGIGGKYFAILIKPEDCSKMVSSVKTSTKSESDYINSQIFLTRSAVASGAPETVQDVYYVYIGPRSENELKKYNNAADNGWGLTNIRFNQALQTTGLFSPIERALKWSLETIFKLVKNWGVAIIVLTIILKILLFPLNKSSSMGSLKMQQIQPRMREIQEKYKDDQQKMSQELSILYKEAGYNPASGCLPMILQMLILLSLYNVFNNYFEFRGAAFIKGWIDDLSVGDSVWTWERQIPFISGFTQNSIRLLPIIYTLSQLLNGKITQYGGAAAGGKNKGQMAFMMYGLPIIFFFLFYNVPSGLLLYWAVSNILQIGQQIIINRMMKKKRAEMESNKPAVNKNVIKFKGGKKKTR